MSTFVPTFRAPIRTLFHPRLPHPSPGAAAGRSAAGMAALLCVLSLAAASPTLAQTAPAQPDLLLRQEQERLRIEQERLRRPAPPSGSDLDRFAPGAPTAPSGGPCHAIDTIDLDGAALLDDGDRDQIEANFIDRCLNARDIEQLMAEVTRHYVERGFVTSRAYLPSQDLTQRRLRLLVQEGRIERIEIAGDPQGRIRADRVVPAQAGDVLNIRDLEQAVDQINSVPGNKVQLDLVPGSAPGQTVVVLRNQASQPYKAFIGLNNQGAPSTGRNGLTGSLSLGSLLRQGEVIDLTARSSIPPGDDDKSSSSVALGVTLPAGYATYAMALSRSEYSTGFDTQLGRHLVASGHSTTFDLKAERLLQRDQRSRHSMTLGYSTTDTRNFVDSSLIGVSSYRTHTLAAGLLSVLFLGDGVLVIRPQVTLGTAAQNNLPAGVNPASDGPQAEFTKATIDVDYKRDFRVAERQLQWSSAFKGQVSHDALFSSQKLLLGSADSVRAYARAPASGDSGFYWRNDLALQHATTLGGQAVKLRGWVGLDVGRVSNRGSGGGSASMTGAALGVGLQAGALALDLSVTRPLSRSGIADDDRTSRVWLGLSVTL